MLQARFIVGDAGYQSLPEIGREIAGDFVHCASSEEGKTPPLYFIDENFQAWAGDLLDKTHVLWVKSLISPPPAFVLGC